MNDGAASPVLLNGERVVLREVTPDDWQAVHAYSTLPEVFVFQPWGPNSPEETRAFVDSIVEARGVVPRGRFALAIVHRTTDGLMGVCELRIKNCRFGIGEIGYSLHPRYWHQGYATDAAKLLLHFGFGVQHLHRIQATCDPRNEASARLLQRIGMQYEGRLRGTMLIRDGWRDSDLYSILVGEWRGT